MSNPVDIAGIGAFDTMLGFPAGDMAAQYAFITRQTKDAESKGEFQFPAEYMFKDSPDKRISTDDPVGYVLHEMDRWGVARGMIGISLDDDDAPSNRAYALAPERFVTSVNPDPNQGMTCIRDIVKAHEKYDARAITLFPAGYFPQVPINDKLMYPIYAKACELGMAVFCCAGIPGPRLKAAPQHVELIDEVMFDFPELTFVSRHGCEPWTELMVKLMLKWPGLHYSTSAFAPRYYPKAIIDYANTRGADKIIYAGYFPMGLSLERIMTEMPNVPFKPEVWPKFLRTNAERVLGL